VTYNQFGHVTISKIEDPRLRIVVALLRANDPIRQSDIAEATKYTPQRVDYHLKHLVQCGVVIPIDDEDCGTRYYALQETFYDLTFMEGMAQILLPLAWAIRDTLEIEPDTDPKAAMKENIRYMVNAFLCTIRNE